MGASPLLNVDNGGSAVVWFGYRCGLSRVFSITVGCEVKLIGIIIGIGVVIDGRRRCHRRLVRGHCGGGGCIG